MGEEKRTNKLRPRMASSPGIEPGQHWWKASALTTTPTLLPVEIGIVFFNPHTRYIIGQQERILPSEAMILAVMNAIFAIS